MSLRDDIPLLTQHIKAQSGMITHNEVLLNIYEGDLLTYVLEDLQKQLSRQSFDMIQHRVAPVNVLKRLIDKLSRIYSEPPTRWLAVEDTKDYDLFNEYLNILDFNTQMQLANEFFNIFKNVAIEPYVRNRKPCLRVVPSDRFTVYSNDPVDPTNPTHYIKFMGERIIRGQRVQVYYLYTAEEFLPINDRGDVIEEILAMSGTMGVNPIGRLPMAYASRSKVNLIPKPDTDTLKMTKIFPVLLSDMNFAIMFQAFSIIYGIDVDDQDILMSPNAFWRFKSDPATQSKPQIGVIKPQVDIQQVVGFIMAQLSFWLQSRNIRPGAVGDAGTENFASGVSKIVDEMDTYEERQKQVPIFTQLERDTWDLILHSFHPYWVREGMIDEQRVFLPAQRVEIEFPKQRPLLKRSEVISECEQELNMRLTTRRNCIMKLNPELSEEEVDELMQEIEDEGTIVIGTSDASAKQQGDHTHETPSGITGPMVLDGTGHYHVLPAGVETSSDPNVAGHTHSLPDGKRTGAPIPIAAEEEEEEAAPVVGEDE